MVVIFVLNHLWGHVLECTAECVSLLHVVRLDAPPEITNLDDVTILDQYVLGLDVSVDETLLM